MAISISHDGRLSHAHLATNVLLIVLPFVIVVGWYWDTALQIGRIWWRSETYAHGLVVIPIFVWLLWRKRTVLAELPPEPTPWALLPLALSGLGWMFGQLVSINALTHAALVTMLVASLIGMLGWRLGRELMFPLAFLFFAVPIGDFMLPTLMRWTGDFTVLALRASGVPVYQEGLFFIVPNGRWSVVEACSGIRYLIASFMVGALYAYLNYRSPVRRALFLGVAILVPILANWVRAYMIVMLGYLSDNRIAVGVDHLLYGWVFFAIVILLMFWIGSFWREDFADESPSVTQGPSGRADGPRAHIVSILLLVVLIFPLAHRYLEQPVEPFAVQLQLPAARDGWTVDENDPFGFRPEYSGHRAELFQVYRNGDGRQVGVYVAYYAEQRDGSELITWANRLVPEGPGAVWRQQLDGRDRLDFGRVRFASVTNEHDSLAVWYWYWSDGRIVASDVRAKMMHAFDRITGRSDDAALIAVFGRIDERAEDVRPLIGSFLADHRDALEAELQRAEATR